MAQTVLILDFGGQYNQLIARRVRECNVYCEVKPNTMTVEEMEERGNPVHHNTLEALDELRGHSHE